MKKTYPSHTPLSEQQKLESRMVVALDLPWWISWKAVQLVDELVRSI